MGVNPIIDKAATQQAAMVGTFNIISELDKMQKNQLSDRTAQSVDKLAVLKKAIDNGNPAEAGMDLISDLIAKVASSGVKLEPTVTAKKALSKESDEYDLLLQTQEGGDDQLEIRSAAYRILEQKDASGHNKQKRENQNGENVQTDPETSELYRDYTVTYAQFLVNGSAELKKKIEVLEAKLSEKGVSLKDLNSVRQNVRQSIRGEITKQIRQAYYQKFLTPQKTMDFLFQSNAVDNLLASVGENTKLGKAAFGGHHPEIQQTSNETGKEAKEELKSFVREEIELRSIQKFLGTEETSKNAKNSQNSDKDLRFLISLAGGLDVDLAKFAKEWEIKKLHLGMNEFTPPPPNSLLAAGTQTNTNSNNQEQKHGFETTLEDEKEILINRMRAIYMVRAMRGDVLTNIETAFKMRKLKNGLIKLGYSMGDFEKLKAQLKQEGEALARMQCLQTLQEAFQERATLYELAGPAHRLIEKKIKGTLNNFERLGVKFSKTELDSLRDKANAEIFDVSLEELQTTAMALKATKNPALEYKQQMLLKLLNRLKEESGLATAIPVVENLGEKA